MTLSIIALGVVMFIYGSLMIKADRFTKVKYTSGITVLKDKQTGCEYIHSTTGCILPMRKEDRDE